MRRRDFIAGLGGAAVVGPRGAWAQQAGRVRRVGLLLPGSDNDSELQMNVQVFEQTMRELGWTAGVQIVFDLRWAQGNPELLRRYAQELVASKPDVLLTRSVQGVTALHNETRTIPIVFANASDPVEAGLVTSLARPGGNITGFTSIAAATNGKWLELLKEFDPAISRVGVLTSAHDPSNEGRYHAIQAAGEALRVFVTNVEVTTAANLDTALNDLSPGSGIIVVPNAVIFSLRDVIVQTVTRHRLPGVYPIREFAQSGGLLAYGQDRATQSRGAAGYVDRILRGEKPADLPVQVPTKYELVINLKTARALGLTVPATLLARADEVIE